jgi:hypothetical protein
VFARPNRKFFGPKRGMTWLNAIFRAKLQQMQPFGGWGNAP